MLRREYFGLIVILCIIASSSSMVEDSKQNSKRTRFLLLDSRIIDQASNAALTVGTVKKDPRNPLFGEDKPWEPRYDNLYANVLYDYQEKIYKCWYSPFIIDHSALNLTAEQREKPYDPPDDREMGVCYAISKDGIHWEKPELGLVEFEGSKKNNIVFRGPHGAGVFKDLREPDSAKRYKMLARDIDRDGVAVAFSPDGLHWSRQLFCPEIDPVHVDGTHYNALWAPEFGKYVGITRLRGSGYDVPLVEPDGKKRKIRQVSRTTSQDFLKWTESELIMQGLETHLQIYSMPVFRYGGVYLGLPVIYNIKTDRAWTELAWSPDTINWHFVDPGTPLIGNSESKGDYDWGCVYTAAYPVFLDNEIRLYYGASNGPHFGWRDGFFCLATLRPDGFAGYVPGNPSEICEILTKPIALSGNSLGISADVETNGFVKVTLFDKDNKKLAESEPVRETVTDAEVKWQKGFYVKNAKDKDVRLKFELKNAKLYSFGFDLKSQTKIDLALSMSVVDRKEDVERIVAGLIEQKKKWEQESREYGQAEQIRRSLPPEEQVPGYIAKLRDEDPDVRSNASDELGKIAKRIKDVKALEPAVAPLLAAVHDADMDVRYESMEALGNIASLIKNKALQKL